MSPTADDVRSQLPEGPLVSEWYVVTQSAMHQFAETTDDDDWMHTDPERARREGFEGTIAFGFWTLSMLTHFLHNCTGREHPDGVRYAFNYGLDRVRFLEPVPVGSRIRNHLQVVDVQDKGSDRFVVTTHNEIELEGHAEPAMIADWLVMYVYGAG